MPRAFADRITRSAISPRLATSSVEIGFETGFETLTSFAPQPTSLVRSPPSHPEDAVGGLGDRRVRGGGEAEAEDATGLGGGGDPVVPEPGGGVVRRALSLVLLEDRRLDRGLLVGAPLVTTCLDAVASHRCQHGRRLLAAHDGDAGVRPHPQEARVVRAAAHAVVAGAEGPADDHGELRDAGGRDGGDELRAVLGDAARLVVAADHEAGDVLEEDERDLALVAELDEVRALERGLAEEDPVVGEDADRVAV